MHYKKVVFCYAGRRQDDGEEPYGLSEFAKEFEEVASNETIYENIAEKGQPILKRLLANREVATELLGQMVSDDYIPEQFFRTVDNHDFTIYRSPIGSYSLKLYVWVPGRDYPIHDHGSWGIVGGYINDALTIRYHREDDGTIPGYARISEKGSLSVRPGDTYFVLPFDDGIHWMGSAGDKVALTTHVYGRALRSGYIQGFDLAKNAVYPLCTPRLTKTIFAVQALGALGGEESVGYLEAALTNRYSLVRWESLLALAGIDHDRCLTLMRRLLSEEEDETVRRKIRSFLNEH